MLQNKAKKKNQNWPQFPDHPYRILLVCGCGSKALLNLIKQQNYEDCDNIDKTYLCVKGPNEAQYQYLIKIKVKMKLVLKSVNVQMLLLNIQVICRMSTNLLKNKCKVRQKM